MKNLNKREKILVIILLVGIISYAYYNFFLSPILDEISTTNTSISQYNGQLDEIKQILQTNEEFKSKYEDAQAKFNIYTEKVPFFIRDPEIAYNLKNLANKMEAKLNTLSITAQSDNSANNAADNVFTMIPVTLDLETKGYIKAMSFINALEQDTRIANINTITMAKAGSQGSTPGVHLNISADFYYMHSTSPGAIEYKFNKSKYGKTDLMK